MTDANELSIYSSDDDAMDETKTYEPDPKLIAKLYCEIKEKKILNLDWKFAGNQLN